MSSNLSAKQLISGRYAKAIFSFGDTDSLWMDFHNFDHLLSSNDKALSIIHFSSMQTQTTFMKIIKAHLNFSKEFNDFIDLLIKNRRLNLIQIIYKNFRHLLDQTRNILTAEIVSAKNLLPAQIDEIQNLLSSHYQKKILLEKKLDPKILAGFVIKVGSSLIDCSLAGKLKNFADKSMELLLEIN